MSLNAKPNSLLKTNATNLKSYSISSSLVHLRPSAMVVHLVLVQVWVLAHPQGSTYWPTTLHMKSLTFKKPLFNKRSNTKPRFSKFPIIGPPRILGLNSKSKVGLIFNTWEPTIAIYTPILAYCKNYLKWFFQASRPKGEKRSIQSMSFFLMHSSKEMPFLQLVLLAKH